MSQFVALTGNSRTAYFRRNAILGICPYGDDQSVIVVSGHSYTVKESPEEVLAMLENDDTGGSSVDVLDGKTAGESLTEGLEDLGDELALAKRLHET